MIDDDRDPDPCDIVERLAWKEATLTVRVAVGCHPRRLRELTNEKFRAAVLSVVCERSYVTMFGGDADRHVVVEFETDDAVLDVDPVGAATDGG